MGSDLAARDPRLLCSAQKTRGRGPCQAYAIRGATVCAAHGGRAPQVRAKARARLDAAADSVMAALIKIALDEREDTAHRLVAMRDLLDRAGYGAKQAVEIAATVSREVTDAERESAALEIAARIDEIRAARALKALP